MNININLNRLGTQFDILVRRLRELAIVWVIAAIALTFTLKIITIHMPAYEDHMEALEAELELVEELVK